MKTLLLIVLFGLPAFSLFAQTNTAAYDQLMTLAGTFINSGNLDAAKQTAQQALQLDSQNWRGNALMAAILQKQNDFNNAQFYIQKAIANAPDDKKDKLNEMAKTIGVSVAQPMAAQSTGPTVEQTIAWMKAHFADLSCTIRASGQYDSSENSQSGGGNEVLGHIAGADRRYGNKAAIYALIPLELSVNDDHSILSVKIFELNEYRYSGTDERSQSYSAAADQNNVRNSSDIMKISLGKIHTLTINLNSTSVAGDVSQAQDFCFECSYLSDANAAPSPSGNDAALAVEMSTSINAYNRTGPVYKLVLRGETGKGDISDSRSFGNALSLSSGEGFSTTVALSDNNLIHNYSYPGLPQSFSGVPATWVDPHQDDTDPTAIKNWILENRQKDLPSGTQDSPLGGPLYPNSIAICNNDPHVLEQWRKALLLLINLNAIHNETDSQATQTPALTYDQLIRQGGSLVGVGNLDAAKQAAQQALQLDSQQWRGNALMAAILDRLGNFDDAQPYLLKALHDAPRPLPFQVVTWAGGHVYVKTIEGIVNAPTGQ